MIYKLKGKKGIDDLKSLFAFRGNSQGDKTQTNSIEDYKNSGGWLSFVFDCELTQEAILEEIELRKLWNERYLEQLHYSNRFGEEYEVELNINHNPELDDSNLQSIHPLESYSFIIEDYGK